VGGSASRNGALGRVSRRRGPVRPPTHPLTSGSSKVCCFHDTKTWVCSWSVKSFPLFCTQRHIYVTTSQERKQTGNFPLIVSSKLIHVTFRISLTHRKGNYKKKKKKSMKYYNEGRYVEFEHIFMPRQRVKCSSWHQASSNRLFVRRLQSDIHYHEDAGSTRF
jgi:hypothetical protein